MWIDDGALAPAQPKASFACILFLNPLRTGRSVSGVAKAVGNTATYYISRPAE